MFNLTHSHDTSVMRHWSNCGVARSYIPDLWLDHLGEIFPSDLRCEELVHHAARPLITRITQTEGDRRSLVATQFRCSIPQGYEDSAMSTHRSSPTLSHIGVGIDTARYGHRVTFLRDDRQPAAAPLTVMENQPGYQQLRQQLQRLHQKHPHAQFHIHIDAAGQYASNLERFLRALDLPVLVSIGEPKRNKDYHKAFFPKRTSDDTESQAMARFGVVEQPPQVPVTPDAFYVLREIASRLQAQSKDTTRATNRLHNLLARVFPELATTVPDLAAAWVLRLLKQYPTPQRIAQARLDTLKQIPYIKPDQAQQVQAVARSSVGSLSGELAESLVRHSVEQLQRCAVAEKELEKLLIQAYDALPRSGHVRIVSIPGIGAATAAALVAKMITIDRFETPEKVVGYFGVFPEENSSGVDRSGEPIPPGTMQMSAKGSDLVRRYLWNAAKSAVQRNCPVRDLYARLRAKGTRGDVALGHCMRKLLHQVFGVWASDQPFDENYDRTRQPPPAQAENEPAIIPPAPTHRAENKKAAGHKREIPQSQVVTAAKSNVQPASPSVKQARANRRGSIDYAYLRQQVTMEQVLSHLGHWGRLRGSAFERRGPCPLHGTERAKSRSFSVNLKKNVYKCFHPDGNQGNVLDFWRTLHNLPLYEAAVHLADTFQLRTKPEQKEKRQPVTEAPQPADQPLNPNTTGVITPDAP